MFIGLTLHLLCLPTTGFMEEEFMAIVTQYENVEQVFSTGEWQSIFLK